MSAAAIAALPLALAPNPSAGAARGLEELPNAELVRMIYALQTRLHAFEQRSTELERQLKSASAAAAVAPDAATAAAATVTTVTTTTTSHAHTTKSASAAAAAAAALAAATAGGTAGASGSGGGANGSASSGGSSTAAHPHQSCHDSACTSHTVLLSQRIAASEPVCVTLQLPSTSLQPLHLGHPPDEHHGLPHAHPHGHVHPHGHAHAHAHAHGHGPAAAAAAASNTAAAKSASLNGAVGSSAVGGFMCTSTPAAASGGVHNHVYAHGHGQALALDDALDSALPALPMPLPLHSKHAHQLELSLHCLHEPDALHAHSHSQVGS